jgi:hypothetical protein
MQNGAAVEANLSSIPSQWAADSRADDRDHPGKPAPEVRAEPPPRPQLLQALLARPPAYQLPRQRLANPSEAGGDDHRACELTRRKCCAASNLSRSVRSGHDV